MARIVGKRAAGEPSPVQPRSNWPRINKPMRPIRSLRTLIKRDESKGVEQPEFKNTLQRAGVGSPQQTVTVSRQKPNTPPSPNAGTRTIKPPRLGKLRKR